MQKNMLAFWTNDIWLCTVSPLILDIKAQFLYQYNQTLVLMIRECIQNPSLLNWGNKTTNYNAKSPLPPPANTTLIPNPFSKFLISWKLNICFHKVVWNLYISFKNANYRNIFHLCNVFLGPQSMITIREVPAVSTLFTPVLTCHPNV